MTQETPGAGGSQLRLDVGDEAQQVGYRGPTVCKIVGISYRQLDYWARTQLVEPSMQKAGGSGTQRLYSFDDVVRLRVVKRLLDTGLSLQKVRMAVDELRARGRSLADATLVSDGDAVLLLTDDAQLLDMIRGGQAVLALALEPVIEELRGEVSAFPTQRVVEAEPSGAADTPLTDTGGPSDPSPGAATS